ncbi:MAG: transposase family protein [Ostreibacterium sp.]
MTKRVYRKRPLSQQDKVFNRLHASVRSTVERTFGLLK